MLILNLEYQGTWRAVAETGEGPTATRKVYVPTDGLQWQEEHGSRPKE